MSKVLVASIKGPKGDTGDITPEAADARDAATAAAAAAALSRDEAAASAAGAAEAALEAVSDADIPGQVEAGITSSPTVTAAAQAAAVTAVNAEIAGRDLVETTDDRLPVVAHSDEVAFAVTGEDDTRSWVEGDNDGDPTPYAVSRIAEKLDLDMFERVPGGGFAIVDEDGNSLPDLIFEVDGSLTLGSVERIVERGSNGFRPTRKASRVYAFGDSLTAADWCKYAQAHTGVWFSHRGIGGQSPNDIAVRQGGVAIAFELNGATQIAGNGGVTNLTKLKPTTGFRAYVGGATWTWTGMLGPVAGTLSHNLDTNAWFFTSAAGTATHTPPASKATFIATADDATRQHAQVLWVGRNELASTLGAVLAMIDHIEYGRPYLVIGVTAITGNAGDLTNVRATNGITAAALHPDDYLDLHAALATEAVLIRMGLTPTSQDLTDIAAGFIPRQIMQGDLIHFTDAGTNAIGQIIGETMQTRGKI